MLNSDKENMMFFGAGILCLVEAIVAWKWPWLVRYNSQGVSMGCSIIAMIMFIVAVMI